MCLSCYKLNLVGCIVSVTKWGKAKLVFTSNPCRVYEKDLEVKPNPVIITYFVGMAEIQSALAIRLSKLCVQVFSCSLSFYGGGSCFSLYPT